MRNMHGISRKYSVLEKEIKAEGGGRHAGERKAFRFEAVHKDRLGLVW